VRRRDIHDAAPVALLHRRQRASDRVEGCRQVDRDDGVPAVGGKALDRRDVLDARVVDQDVDAGAARLETCEQRFDVGRPGEVGRFVIDAHAVGAGEFDAQSFDLVRIAEPVDHEVGALARERARDAQADAARRAGDERQLSFHHGLSLYNPAEL